LLLASLLPFGSLLPYQGTPSGMPQNAARSAGFSLSRNPDLCPGYELQATRELVSKATAFPSAFARIRARLQACRTTLPEVPALAAVLARAGNLNAERTPHAARWNWSGHKKAERQERG